MQIQPNFYKATERQNEHRYPLSRSQSANSSRPVPRGYGQEQLGIQSMQSQPRSNEAAGKQSARRNQMSRPQIENNRQSACSRPTDQPRTGNIQRLPRQLPANFSEEDTREAIIDHAKQKCCWGLTPAKNMKFTDCKQTWALHYRLETFTESRLTYAKSEPYEGGGVRPGIIPHIWAIKCPPDKMFETHKKEMEVPFSARIQQCLKCKGRGHIKCGWCNGMGNIRIQCGFCNGTGRNSDPYSISFSCSHCKGKGGSNSKCWICSGRGEKRCKTCDTDGRVRCFTMLVCKFTNHTGDVVYNQTDIPDKDIKKAKGKSLFQESYPLVYPIQNYAIEEMNEESKRLVEEHQKKWPKKRILRQRHNLRSVQIFEVEYEWERKRNTLWVYGNERSVYSPKYPAQCCWGCTII